MLLAVSVEVRSSLEVLSSLEGAVSSLFEEPLAVVESPSGVSAAEDDPAPCSEVLASWPFAEFGNKFLFVAGVIDCGPEVERDSVTEFSPSLANRKRDARVDPWEDDLRCASANLSCSVRIFRLEFPFCACFCCVGSQWRMFERPVE